LYGLENFTLYPVQELLDLTPVTFKRSLDVGSLNAVSAWVPVG